jgi:hypothetical protein
MIGALTLLVLLVLGYDLTGKPSWQATLPDELAEISGQAFTSDGRLFAHGDEQAAIFRIDPRTGRVVEGFTVAPTGHDPDLVGNEKRKGGRKSLRAVAGDFEDLAIAGNRFFLASSNGFLLEFSEGRNGSQVAHRAHDTGLNGKCEVEGMTHDAVTRSLLLLCKNRRGKGKDAHVAVYAWSLKSGRTAAEPRLEISSAALARVTDAPEFSGSAIAVSPGGDSFLLVAGPQQTFAEVGRDGRVLRGGAFPRGVYRQPEAAAFAPDGSLLISSEAAGKHATIAGYLPVKG